MSGYASTVVKQYNGVPTIFVDGQPIHGMTATSVAFGDPQVVRDFVSSGVEIMMIWIEIGIKCWKAPGEYDWSYAEEKLKFFEEHSADTKWIIRIRLGLVAEWFRQAHPDEVHNPPPEQAGLSVANLVSPVWREKVGEVLQAFVKWLRTTKWAPRIIGFMLNAGSTEEWLIFDTDKTYRGNYQKAYGREFRKYLTEKYGSDARLQKAWNDKKATLEKASPPVFMVRKGSHIWGPFSLRDPKLERQAIDYYRFLNETLADALIHFCRVTKEAAETPVICGGFHSYLWWETGIYSYIQEYGHTLIQRLNESPWVDFISDITSYDNRYAGGPSGYLSIPHSMNVHNKLHYTEVDLRTIKNMSPEHLKAWKKINPADIPVRTAEPAVPDRIWKWSYGYCGRDMGEQQGLLQREHLHNLITGTPYWWFDIGGHEYQAPELVKTLKHMSNVGKEAINWDRSTISEVAFVLSEETPFYQACMNGELMRFELESIHPLLIDLSTRGWGSAGIPFDTYELHDLMAKDFPGDQYKMLVFVNCAYVSAKAAKGIRRWQKDGKTFLWTYAPGVMGDDALDPAKAEPIIGMKLGWRNQRQNIHIEMENSKHPLVKGGKALNFGTEGSAGPVFFAQDPKAKVLGRLRDGGEAGFALRDHGDWRSIYLSMHNFNPALMRNLTRFAGASVWCETNDVVYANRSMVCLHTASAGKKRIKLPAKAIVTDLMTGKRNDRPTQTIDITMPAYRTMAWRTEYVK